MQFLFSLILFMISISANLISREAPCYNGGICGYDTDKTQQPALFFSWNYNDKFQLNPKYKDFYQSPEKILYLDYSGPGNNHNWPMFKLENLTGTGMPHPEKRSFFFISSLGNGFQAELKGRNNPGDMQNSIAGRIAFIEDVQQALPGEHLLEVQEPFGNPRAVFATDARNQPKPKWAGGNSEAVIYGFDAEGNAILKAHRVDQGYGRGDFPVDCCTAGAPKVQGNQYVDFLNEAGTRTKNNETNKIFLDTLINNGNTDYDIAVTKAPLEEIVTQLNIPSQTDKNMPSKLDDMIDAFYSDQPPVGSYETKLLSGDATINFDNRFRLFAKSKHNPGQFQLALKRHMASPWLSFNVSSSPTGSNQTDWQTIVLLPSYSKCDPVIFIGRDTRVDPVAHRQPTNRFSVLSYIRKNCLAASTATLDAMANTVSTNPFTDPNPIQGGTAGRVKVVIGPKKFRSEQGESSLNVGQEVKTIKDIWYPTQPDFVD